jgi:very-short-patch-repair endonuclease
MDPQSLQSVGAHVWALAEDQHDAISRQQLLELGLTGEAIRHRVSRGRLHLVWRGVYAVGRPRLSRHGLWMAAVLACGTDAVLSHESAAALWGILPDPPGSIIHVSVPLGVARSRPGIAVHRRANLRPVDIVRRDRIPVTAPVCTLVDIAARRNREELEAAVNQADKLDLVDPETLRTAIDDIDPRPGVRPLRQLLDRRTFTLTDSELERRFLPIARRAGLPLPIAGARVNGFKVDFWWPTLGLVVETDGLRYHRTAAQQTRDRLRDQAHSAAGMTPLRFTHAQVRFEPGHVEATLMAVARRLEPGHLGTQ